MKKKAVRKSAPKSAAKRKSTFDAINHHPVFTFLTFAIIIIFGALIIGGVILYKVEKEVQDNMPEMVTVQVKMPQPSMTPMMGQKTAPSGMMQKDY